MVFASFAISTWPVLSGVQLVSAWSYAGLAPWLFGYARFARRPSGPRSVTRVGVCGSVLYTMLYTCFYE
jgi:hypothetical protein